MRTYEVTGKIILKTESPDDGETIKLLVPDAITGSDLDRAIERLRRDVRRQERN